jgi:hypothetical protein
LFFYKKRKRFIKGDVYYQNSSEGDSMITVCEKHIKEAINLLDVPHVQSLHPKYGEHSCKFCGDLANYKLFYSTPIENSLFKIKQTSNVS